MIEKSYSYNKKFTRVLVISDSHGQIGNAVDIIEIGNFDHIIHLGDVAEDVDDLRNIFEDAIIHSVRGNCDFFYDDIEEMLVIEINGTRIFACHGHQFGVKSSTNRLEQVTKKVGADIGLFGHSHRQLLKSFGKIILMNPGSLSLPRDGRPCSCGILEIEKDGRLHCNIHEFKKKKKRI